jgi:glucarate dehydratase
VPLAVRLHGRSEGEIVALAREMADRGFHTVVIGSCGELESDVERLLAVRETAGPRVQIRLDAAGQYDMDTARALCRALEGESLDFVLDPLRSESLDESASLRRQTSVPLAAGRVLHGPADVLAAVRCGAAQQVCVDPARVGGIAPTRKCGAIVHAAAIDASLSSGYSLGIAAAAVLQLAAATPAFSGATESCYHELKDDLLAERLEIIDGMLTVPHGPGLGVEIDRAKIERYAAV